jgi:hypothetical protein
MTLSDLNCYGWKYPLTKAKRNRIPGVPLDFEITNVATDSDKKTTLPV